MEKTTELVPFNGEAIFYHIDAMTCAGWKVFAVEKESVKNEEVCKISYEREEK